MIKLLIFAILAQMLASCATSYERKDGSRFTLELTGNLLDYYRAANGQERLVEPRGYSK
jgi:hypothetical protein